MPPQLTSEARNADPTGMEQMQICNIFSKQAFQKINSLKWTKINNCNKL